jgi:hypothetical protein
MSIKQQRQIASTEVRDLGISLSQLVPIQDRTRYQESISVWENEGGKASQSRSTISTTVRSTSAKFDCSKVQ